MSELAKVIPMPGIDLSLYPIVDVKERLCSDCVNGYLGASGVYCRLFGLDIFLETEAQECEAYEE